jgi:DNA repair exonuclease SbcCD nuclease subunit
MDKLRRAGFDYVALGHIHKPDVHPKAAIAYAGALEPIDRGDEGEHGYILGEIGESRTSVNFIPFACREYRKLKVPMTSEMTKNELSEMIRYAIHENGDKNIYKLIIEGRRSADLELDPSELARLGNIISVTDQSVPDYDYDRIYMENRDNIIGMYIEKIRAMDIDENLKARALYQGMRAFAHAQEESAG